MDFVLKEEIGHGQYGVVYKAEQLSTKKIYACKRMDMKVIKEKGAIEDVNNEIRNLNAINHPNVIKLTEEHKTPDYHYLFFEYCNGGNLAKLREV